jgi:Na+/proline symporter
VIGSILARFAIAWWLVPAYYEREIYSPYDYMGARLGPKVRGMATALFALGGVVVAGGARLSHRGRARSHPARGARDARRGTHVPSLVLAIGLISLFAVLWTWIGGIVTVIWTDVLLFFVFTASAVIALVVVIAQQLDLGFARIWRVASTRTSSRSSTSTRAPCAPTRSGRRRLQ